MPSPIAPPKPLAPDLSAHWRLKPGLTFLNHGSFGAVPEPVRLVADGWRHRIESEPIEMLGRRWKDLMLAPSEALARFLHTEAEAIGFVANATEGINSVLRSLAFGPGDELLTTTHVYNAVRQAMRFVAGQSGATYRELDVPLPVRSTTELAQTIVDAIGDRTRLLVVDHVTSPTAIVFPIEAIARVCAARNIDLLVDGAHAPGMIPIDLAELERIGVSYYVGNLHKWCCAPKGTGFLWARGSLREQIHPLVISHGYEQGFWNEFQWQGTRDMTGWLTTPAALAFFEQFGWENVRRYNHDLAVWAHAMLCRRFDVDPITPPDGSLLGSMATVRLPAKLGLLDAVGLAELQQRLYDDHQIEAMFIHWREHRFLRVSCQIYNQPADYERLLAVLAPMF